MSIILLADDSPHAQRMGERILREEGYEVVSLTDGRTAAFRMADVDPDHPEKLVEWLLERQPKLITDDHWKLIDEHERTSGQPHGRPRVKLTNVAELLRIGHG